MSKVFFGERSTKCQLVPARKEYRRIIRAGLGRKGRARGEYRWVEGKYQAIEGIGAR